MKHKKLFSLILITILICLLGTSFFFKQKKSEEEVRQEDKKSLKKAFDHSIPLTPSASLKLQLPVKVNHYPQCRDTFAELLKSSFHESLERIKNGEFHITEDCLSDVDLVLGKRGKDADVDKEVQAFVLRLLAVDSAYPSTDEKDLRQMGADILYHKLLASILLRRLDPRFFAMADEILARGEEKAYDAHKLKIIGGLPLLSSASSADPKLKESFVESLQELSRLRDGGDFPQTIWEQDFLDELLFMTKILKPDLDPNGPSLKEMALNYEKKHPESFRGAFYQGVIAWEKQDREGALRYLRYAQKKIKDSSESAVVESALRRIEKENISFKESILAFSLSLDMKRLAHDL